MMIVSVLTTLLFTPVLTLNKCGVASGVFYECADCIDAAVDCGMSFWWNWGPDPKSPKISSGLKYKNAEFIPMAWSSVDNVTEIVHSLMKGTYLMGWNEPDHYGPPCWNVQDVGGWKYPGCDGQSYSAAASAGTFLPYFNPTAPYSGTAWATFIKSLLATGLKMPQIVSPSMAGPAAGGDKLAECKLVTNESLAKQGEELIANIGNCDGWLGEFKKATLAMTCGATNCWDIIDHIQIHSYSVDAKAAIDKIENYLTAFKEDFQGLNGRTKKTIWLTEVAGASDQLDHQVQFVKDLLPYLESKAEVFRYSWFSEWFFSSFTIDGKKPETPNWTSNLFNPSGKLSSLGVEYFTQCNGGTLPSTCKQHI